MKRLLRYLSRDKTVLQEFAAFAGLMALAQGSELFALSRLSQALNGEVAKDQALFILGLFAIKGVFLVGSGLAASWMLLRIRYGVRGFLSENLDAADFLQARSFARDRLLFAGQEVPESLGNLITGWVQLIFNAGFLLVLFAVLFRSQPALAFYGGAISLTMFAFLLITRRKLRQNAARAVVAEADCERSWSDLVSLWGERKMLGLATPPPNGVSAHFTALARRDFWRHIPPAFTDVIFLAVLLGILTLTTGLQAQGAGAVISAIIFFQRIQSRMQNTLTAIQQIRDEMPILDGYLGPQAAPERLGLEDIAAPSLSAENLSFNYPSAPHLFEGLSFTIHPGDWVRLKGGNGTGKSTLAMLLMGFIAPTDGRVAAAGLFRRRMLTSTPTLIKGQLFENIDLGRGYSHAQIETRLRELGLWSMIAPLTTRKEFSPSAGERQLIGLARALMDDPHLLILDEATSHLAKDLEERIFHILHARLPNAMVVLITHREPSVSWSLPTLALGPDGHTLGHATLDC